MRSLTKILKIVLGWKFRKRGVGGVNVRIKIEDGVSVSGKEEVKEVWKSKLECLIIGKLYGVY